MSSLPCLAEYESLVRQHQEQFSPALAQLQVSVDEALDHLRQQERSLVEAQAQQLAQLQAQLATNARCLLSSRELQAFMTEIRAIPMQTRWNQPEFNFEVDANAENWQLAQTDFTLGIREYETTADHDAYDDERTHSGYGYAVTIQVGDQTKRLEVLTHRVYSPIEQRDYNVRDQLDCYVEAYVEDLLELPKIEQSIKPRLAREISYLLGCAVRLLCLTPHLVEFHYSSREVGA